MLCAVWYYLRNLKNVKNTHGGVLFLVKLQTSACNLTKSYTNRWVFFISLNYTNGTKSPKASHILTLINSAFSHFRIQHDKKYYEFNMAIYHRQTQHNSSCFPLTKIEEVFSLHQEFSLIKNIFKIWAHKMLESPIQVTTWAEAYSEPSQTSKMQDFVKIVNGCQPLTIVTKSFILYV